MNNVLMVNEFLASLVIAEAQTFNNLTILPLISDKPVKMKLKTLNEGLADGTIEITEVEGDGNVPLLKFVNNGDAALAMEGEIITHDKLKQNRTLKQSFIIYRHSVVCGDVFCCEAGRWRVDRAHKGFKRDRHISPSIRKSFSKSNQSRVWEQIREKSQRMNVHSETSAVDQIYEQYQNQIDQYERAFTLGPNHVGMIALINKKPIALDASCVTEIFHKQFPSLLSGLVTDALDSDYCHEIASYRDTTAEDFVKSIMMVKKIIQDTTIGGTGYRFDEDGIVGGALLNHGVVIQMSAFAEA